MCALSRLERRRPAGPVQPTKLLRVITRLNIGGPAVHTVLLMRGLRPLGYDTALVAGACESADGDMSYLLQPGDPVISMPELSRSVSPLRNLKALWRMWRLMRREKPGIVHTHTAMAGCVGRLAALLAGVPVVVHTFHGNSLKHYFSPIVSAAFRKIETWLARFTDAICVVSEQQAEELSAVFGIAPRRQFRVVPLGLDLTEYLRVPPTPPSPVLRVAWLGRFVAVKNVSLLVRVMEETLALADCIEFVVGGDGPDRELVRDAAARFGPRVLWRGWETDLPGLLAQCHVLIQTSTNEGTPLALIQGMAAARPFISTPAGGVVDMVAGEIRREQDGCRWYDNGILAEPDPRAFAAALIRLASDRAQLAALGSAARNFAAGRFSIDRLVSDLDALYRELLHRKTVRQPISFEGETSCTC
jgi:glycosyltransferase involved in cell wall biosynthesis